MKYRALSYTAAIAAAVAMPTYSLAADSEFDSSTDYSQRAALSNRIKTLRELRKKLPIPVPAGLFGIYAFPEKGQGVAGINYQNYEFSGLVRGSDSISAQTAVTTTPNRFFGLPGQPPTLRVVPRSASAHVAFPFANFAISDDFAVVALAPLIHKSTVLETFAGGAGTVSLGTNTVTSQGLGDIKFGGLYKAYNNGRHGVIIDAVLSAPTGSITVSDKNLTPANTIVNSRLGYGMQLGTGTWDALVGVSYWGKEEPWGWGAQYLATVPLEARNSEGWRYADKHEGTAWLSYSWKPTLVTSVRVRGETQDSIKGIDPNIFGPGQGGDPDNYGGEKLELALGVNWMYGLGHNISMEFSKPVYQDRNGVQADQDYSFMLSWRNGFF